MNKTRKSESERDRRCTASRASSRSNDSRSFADPIYVTRPSLPSLDDYRGLLESTWEERWLTNNGPYHRQLEDRLRTHLGVDQISLFCNGTIALLVALQALRINSGEVITTPFTFPATPHVLYWNRVNPTFCDIELETFNLDPERIEPLINPNTKAILAVHVFGRPCRVEAIKEIAQRHGLPVIYDASHAFGVEYKGQSVLRWGDLSTLSFHATKLYSTAEGGAIIAPNEIVKQRVDFLKNFGIADEETVIGPGINGKMNELQAAYGLLTLESVAEEIAGREGVDTTYRTELEGMPGLTIPAHQEQTQHNYSYFPVLIDPSETGVSRDAVYEVLRRHNVYARKYFYPLCNRYSCYSALPSSNPENIPIAEKVGKEVLCLPIYGSLNQADVRQICAIIRDAVNTGVGV